MCSLCIFIACLQSLLYPMLHVSLDCPFLIVAAVFSNAYSMYCYLSNQYSVCILTLQVFYKRQKLPTLHEHMGSSPDLGGVRVAHLFSFLCRAICFVCLSRASCVPNVTSVSGFSILDCPLGFLKRFNENNST